MPTSPLVLPIFDGLSTTGNTLAARHEHVRKLVRAKLKVELPHHGQRHASPLPRGDFERPWHRAAARAIPARIYRGTWIVDCPWCNSAEMAWCAEPWFLCTNCLNAVIGGETVEVAFPKDADMARIEAILRARPLLHNRNWAPIETVEALARENAEHGLPEVA